MTKLSEENRAFFENTLNESKKHIEIIDARIEEELVRVKETINQLQEQRSAMRQIYDGAASMLGIKNEFEQETEPAEAIEPNDTNNTNEANGSAPH